MMKNLSKNVVVSIFMVIFTLIILTNVVNALALIPDNTATSNNAIINEIENEVENEVGNTTMNIVNNTTTVLNNNVTKVNEIATEKDLPQTGENDVYMISVIGIAAVVIGSIAYAKSKKYDI